jgi:hypothetical protein
MTILLEAPLIKAAGSILSHIGKEMEWEGNPKVGCHLVPYI